jgi:PAT family beta-lactamase induction signal transducer AmpG
VNALLASLNIYTQRKLIIVTLLGFSSGLPIVLTASTLSAWLGESGVDKTTIGLFAFVALAYSLNFAWAPVIDHFQAPNPFHRLGRRRGWLLCIQLCLASTIIGLGFTNPMIDASLTALMAVLVAFCSATQDIVVDAYRTEVLDKDQYGEGAAAGVFGYRVGMLVSGAGALILADHLSWQLTFLAMAGCIGIGILTTLFAKEPAGYKPSENESIEQHFKQAIIAPFKDFMLKDGWWIILLFIFAFRLSDSFVGLMINPFLLEIGFTKTEIGSIAKVYGLVATLAGTALGAALIRSLGMYQSMMIAILFQMAANMVYIAQVQAGADPFLLILTISLDNLSVGICTATMITFIMNLTNIRYTATQYALLSSIASFGRTTIASSAGWVADNGGWETLFITSAVLAIPAIILLWSLRKSPFFDKKQA